MENTENAVAVNSNNSLFLGEVMKESFTTIDTTDIEKSKMLFNKMNNADDKIFDMIGQEIDVIDVYIEKFDSKDDDGELLFDDNGCTIPKYRTILFTSDGNGYVTTGYGIFNIVRKMLHHGVIRSNMNEPVTLRIVNTKTRNGLTTQTLELV